MFIIIVTLFSFEHNEVLRTIGSDLHYITSSPSRWEKNDHVKFAGLAASAGTIMFLDDEIRDEVQNYNGRINNLANALEPFGSKYGIGLLGGGYILGCLLDNNQLKHLSLRASESALITTGFVYLVKITTGRKRPYMDEGPYRWTGPNMESRRMSMPSAHTGFAFAVASYVSSEIEHPMIKILAYGTAIMVGYTRIKNDKHWASDVFLGASIGIAVGKTISMID